MRWAVDLIYVFAAVITSPVWLTRMIVTGKIRTDWAGRFGGAKAFAPKFRSRVLIHAVSVGEVNAARLLVGELAREPDGLEVVISSTTDTGVARATALFGGRHRVVRYPLDFSFAVARFLNAVRPDLVVLVELEVWPGFTAACAQRGVPVAVVNGRLTERSLRRYRLVSGAVRPSFRRLPLAAVQSEVYARRFEAMGVPPDRVVVTGTMKWDTAEIADHVVGAEELAADMGIDRSRPLVVAGSTEPLEHALLASAIPAGVQLLCAPRRPEWFDDAAAALPGCARRSQNQRGSDRGFFLLDTIGELRLAYALADVVVVGRTFGRLHGSDMMEPVALGKVTIVGPRTSDFQDTVDALLAGGGIVQTDAAGLAGVLASLLADPAQCQEIARRGRAVLRVRQGATALNVQLLRNLLRQPSPDSRAP